MACAPMKHHCEPLAGRYEGDREIDLSPDGDT